MVMEIEMSKTYQYRKVMKPMLERKRRARINKCLDNLKDLMVDCLTQEGEHVTRLEKADILELTVQHMKRLKRRGKLSLGSDKAPSYSDCFRSGYVQAANQISKVLASTGGVDVELGTKVMTYLGQRLHDLNDVSLHMTYRSPDSPSFQCSFESECSCKSKGLHQPVPGYCEKEPLDLKHSVMDISKDPVWRPW